MVVKHRSSKSRKVCAVDEISEIKKSNVFRFSMLISIAHIIRFFIFAKITKWRIFSEKRKKCVFFIVFAKKKQLKLKLKKSLICAISIIVKNMW